MRALAASDRLGLTRYISQQIKYSLLDRDCESELLKLGVHEGVGALIWGPLASGYLSGKFRDNGQTQAPCLSSQAGRLEHTAHRASAGRRRHAGGNRPAPRGRIAVASGP